jgi:hypothetical protein
MAGPIASRLSLILPRIVARVQLILSASPPSGFITYSNPLDPSAIIESQDPFGTFPMVPVPPQMVVLSVEDFESPAAQGERGGGPEQQWKRVLGCVCWSRASELDQSHQHIIALTSQANPPSSTNQSFNHLDLEEWTVAALQDYFVSDTNIPPNQISSQCLQWLTGTRPSAPSQQSDNRFWLSSRFQFEVKWTPKAMSANYPGDYFP